MHPYTNSREISEKHRFIEVSRVLSSGLLASRVNADSNFYKSGSIKFNEVELDSR